MPSFPHGQSLDELIEATRAPERQIRIAGWDAFEAEVKQEVRRTVTPELLEALLLLATEPEETREQNERAAPVFAERFPAAEIHSIENAGYDLIADAGLEVAGLIRDWASRN